MQRSAIQARINEARNLSHDESRKQILSNIQNELQPVVNQMSEAIGRKAGMIYEDPSQSFKFDDEGNLDSDAVISYESGFTGETVYLNTTSLDDMRGLVRVRTLIQQLEVEKAYDKAQSLDTAVREYIPDGVWTFLCN
jgi:hypothetical protein